MNVSSPPSRPQIQWGHFTGTSIGTKVNTRPQVEVVPSLKVMKKRSVPCTVPEIILLLCRLSDRTKIGILLPYLVWTCLTHSFNSLHVFNCLAFFHTFSFIQWGGSDSFLKFLKNRNYRRFLRIWKANSTKLWSLEGTGARVQEPISLGQLQEYHRVKLRLTAETIERFMRISHSRDSS